MNRSEFIIDKLQLTPLAGESGFINQAYRSNIEVSQGDRVLQANNSIYYLLNRERPINYLHWLSPDDTHVLCEGGPVDYYVFAPDGAVQCIRLGMDLAAAERPALMIPGGYWKALKLSDEVDYALMTSILTPQWTRDRCKIGAGQAFIDTYAGQAEWATPVFLKELIGDNFKVPDSP